MRRSLRLVVLPTAAALAWALGGCGSQDPDSYVRKAVEYRAKHETKAAIIELKNALAGNPDHAEARFLLGLTYDEADEPQLAEKELHRAAELGYDRTLVLPRLGRAMLMAGQPQKLLDELGMDGVTDPPLKAKLAVLRGQAMIDLGRAGEGRALVAQALSSQPQLPEALMAHAALAAADRKLDDARRYAERALASDPRHVDAWLLKADLSRMAGDGAEAGTAYGKALEIRPANIGARLGLAMVHIDRGALDEARVQVQRVRKEHPGHLMAAYTHGLIEFRARNFPAARDVLAQVLKVAPESPPVLLLAGAVDAAMGSYAQAQSRLEKVLEAAPGNVHARKILVAALAQNGQMHRASEMLQPALKQAQGDAEVLRLAGELHARNGEFDKAAEYFERAARTEPRNPVLRTRLGVSRIALGQTERGLDELNTAATLDIEGHQADVALVLAHLRARRYDDALTAIRKLEEKQPDNPMTYNLMAGAYSGKNDAPAARKALERALALQPTYVPAAVNLARMDLKQGDKAAARRRLESIVQTDRDNVTALIALADLGPELGASHKERIEWLEHAGRAEGPSFTAKLKLAQLHVAAGQAEKALNAAEQARAVHPDNPRVIEMLGAVQLAAGRREQALMTFTRLVGMQPDSAAALHHLASAQAAIGNADLARGTLSKAVALKRDYAPAYALSVQIDLRAGRTADALKTARALQKETPKSPNGHALEGDVLAARGEFAAATKAYESAYALQRSGALVMKIHGAQTRAGREAEADARIAGWLRDFPDDDKVRLYAADASLRRGDVKQAISHYETMREKLPQNVMVLNNLAWAYHLARDARALETAERAYKLGPDYAAVADTLGWILAEQGRTDRALPLLKKAVEAAPQAPSIRYHYAYASYKAGDRAGARAELERVLASGANFEQQAEAKALLEKLRE